MLYKRYANPHDLIDSMLSSNGFSDFISHLIDQINKETEEQVQWEFYLHKVSNMTFSQYLKSIEESQKAKEEIKPQNLETTIKETINIFNIELN